MSFNKKTEKEIRPEVFLYLLKEFFPYRLFLATKNIWPFFCVWQKPGFKVFEKFEDINPLSGAKKFRRIHAPNVSMRLIHGFFIKNFLRKLPIKKDLRFATGGRRGWNPLRNIERHRNGRFFYLIDIKDFYDNIDGKKLSEILCSLDKRFFEKETELFEFLKKFFLLEGGRGLITGAPASVDLANIYLAYTVDLRLVDICRKHEIYYSRYLDDLTFSSKGAIGKRIRKKIREIVLEANFQLSHRKSKYLDIFKGPVFITGVGMKAGGETFIPRSYLRKIRGANNLCKQKRLPFKNLQGMMSAFFATTRKRAPFAFNRKIDERLVFHYRRLEKIHKK